MNLESEKLKELLQGEPLTPGTLYVVATPIGNLADLSFRAINVLRRCDFVLAEDTRRTGLLLHLLGIKKPLISCHKFNEASRWNQILERLRNGQTAALVSDAGTPGISDPGSLTIQKAVELSIRIEPVPGPVAFVTALMGAGLPTDEIHFVGFLPKKEAQLRERVQQLLKLPGTLAVYESPYRLGRLIALIAQLAPERQLVIARELTKRFEEFVRGKAAELHQKLAGRVWKGEAVVLIGPEEDSSDKI